MTEAPDTDEQDAREEGPSLWTRVFRGVLPDRVARRWDRLPEGSQKDAAHYNMRSGL
jgi:hypothetical protein